MRSKFKKVKLSISALRVFGKESFSFQSMLSSLGFVDMNQRYTVRRIMNIIRSKYYIFCCINKPRNNPDLIKYYNRSSSQ